MILTSTRYTYLLTGSSTIYLSHSIVEAYTFNFDVSGRAYSLQYLATNEHRKYHKIPGTDVSVPVMTLDADLERLSLHGKKTFDPVSDASKQGRVPTLGEVKKSLKVRDLDSYDVRMLTGYVL